MRPNEYLSRYHPKVRLTRLSRIPDGLSYRTLSAAQTKLDLVMIVQQLCIRMIATLRHYRLLSDPQALSMIPTDIFTTIRYRKLRPFTFNVTMKAPLWRAITGLTHASPSHATMVVYGYDRADAKARAGI